MASKGKDIKRRILTVQSTQKITNAMKLVSAAKFARASHAIQSARPYGEAFNKMVSNLLASGLEGAKSPLLRETPEKKVLLIVVATDRGLCGSLNTNVFKNAAAWLREQSRAGAQVHAIAWGRRAGMFVKRENVETIERTEKVLDKPNYLFAKEAAEKLTDWFTKERYDAVYIAYPKYQSALVQTPRIERLLPVKIEKTAKVEDAAQTKDFIVEPSLDALIDSLLMRRVTSTIFNIMLEGAASEHGARMSAMDSATSNAKQVIKKLTLAYNRARQAAITTELTEIISGAESLH